MEFWAFAEVFQPADAALDRVRRFVGPALNSAFAASNLASLEIKLRYVPIVMPEGMREWYPARSKIVKKEKLFDCAPQLNYEVFVNGTFNEQLREYLCGIALTAPYLTSLGVTPHQVQEFEYIVSNYIESMIFGRPDTILH